MQTDSFSCGPHANVLKSRGSTRQETAVFIKFNFFPLKKYAAFSLLQKKLCKPTPATCRCFKEAWLKNRGNCFVHKIYFLPPQKNTPHFRSFKKCYVSLLDTNLLPPCNDETPTVIFDAKYRQINTGRPSALSFSKIAKVNFKMFNFLQ